MASLEGKSVTSCKNLFQKWRAINDHSLKVCISKKIWNGYHLAKGRPWKCCSGTCAHFSIEIQV